jgi:Asp-tRNA(Asn)/Glu-tRNA(Gln) amidotransferase A subunit family amidase
VAGGATSSPPLGDLVALAGACRRGEAEPAAVLAAFAEEFERRNAEVLALLPEPGRFDRLAREARALAARWPDPAARPPLYGVPVGVKDVFRADGFPTGAGSRLPPLLFAGPEAEAVALLRRAGALVLGKTVSTEFAYFAPGPTVNPHSPPGAVHTPGGSSSGSAAAVGAALCPLALGTQTIGSIGRPAAYCGVVGFKPTHGRISTAGVVPLSPALDHVGFFTAGARGAALAASVLCPPRPFADAQDAKGRGRPVLGIPAGPYLERADPDGREHFERVCRGLAGAGFEVRRTAAFADFAAIEARHRRIVAADAARVHAEWFAAYPDLYAPETAELIRAGRAVASADLAEALAGRESARGELLSAMDGEGIDLWISPPARGEAPAGLASTGDPVMNLPWTYTGLPTVVLPAGRGPGGLPMGLQLAGRPGADEALLAWAALVEETLGR